MKYEVPFMNRVDTPPLHELSRDSVETEVIRPTLDFVQLLRIKIKVKSCVPT